MLEDAALVVSIVFGFISLLLLGAFVATLFWSRRLHKVMDKCDWLIEQVSALEAENNSLNQEITEITLGHNKLLSIANSQMIKNSDLSNRASFWLKNGPPRCGDTIKHIPSNENWVVAWADGNTVAPFGWPSSRANLIDCKLARQCSDREHVKLVKDGIASGGINAKHIKRLYVKEDE